MITVLTPTGARPEAFAQCVDLMRDQTYAGMVRWVIVDDGPEPETFQREWPEGWDLRIIRPAPLWTPGKNTLARNILEGLPHCSDRVVIVEDDDLYAPWWLEKCTWWLDHHDLVGESHSLYMNRLSGTNTEMKNQTHASLCSTALKGSAKAALKAACESGPLGIDIRLWRGFQGAKQLYPPKPRGVTGVKGWPGRPGIGVGHRL